MKIKEYSTFDMNVYNLFLKETEEISYIGPTDFNNYGFMSKIGHSQSGHYYDFVLLVMITYNDISKILQKFSEKFKLDLYTENNYFSICWNEKPYIKGFFIENKCILFIRETMQSQNCDVFNNSNSLEINKNSILEVLNDI